MFGRFSTVQCLLYHSNILLGCAVAPKLMPVVRTLADIASGNHPQNLKLLAEKNEVLAVHSLVCIIFLTKLIHLTNLNSYRMLNLEFTKNSVICSGKIQNHFLWIVRKVLIYCTLVDMPILRLNYRFHIVFHQLLT